MEYLSFIERILPRLPKSPPTGFVFDHWPHGGRPTAEVFAILPIAGLDPARVMARVMAIDQYVGNVEHVAISRSIPDSRFAAPDQVRFYQKVELPMLGAIHQELVLHRCGEQSGYQVAAWELLKHETDALSAKEGFRADFSHGAWFAAPGMLGYGFGSAPKREDVGFLKWKVLTAGADAAAPRVIRANIEGMARWAAKA